MRNTFLVRLLALALAVSPTAGLAQTPTCNATVTLRSFAEVDGREGGWDLVFDVAAPSCDSSSGSFEYVVELDAGGKRQRVTESAEFTTEKGQKGALKVQYNAKPGWTVKGVSGVSVRRCACGVPGR